LKSDKSCISNPKSEISNRTRHRNSTCSGATVLTDQKKSQEIQRRLISFGARTTRVAKMLPRTEEGRYISQQLLRSGLAAAPNYAEARAAESRADFIHKLRIVLKELNETRSWLEQIVANSLFSRDKMDAIIAENQELCWIVAASIKTARGSAGPI
jgi:four helix bundle protein